MSFYNVFDLLSQFSGNSYYYYFITFKSIILGFSYQSVTFTHMLLVFPLFIYIYILLFITLNLIFFSVYRLKTKFCFLSFFVFFTFFFFFLFSFFLISIFFSFSFFIFSLLYSFF